MPRPIKAHLFPDAIRHNYRQAQALMRQSNPDGKVWAVLKANAYGHGIEVVGLALRDHADGFAVLELAEAIALRRMGCTQPILLLEGLFSPEDFLVVRQFNLEIVIATDHHMAMLEKYLPAFIGDESATENKPPTLATIKINTGMNRLGFSLENAEKHWQTLQQWEKSFGGIKAHQWMSHFANADVISPAQNATLMNTMHELAALIAKHPAPLCVANSAGLMFHPNTHAQGARAGIMLYGASPSVAYDAKDCDLQCAMSLTSEVIALQTIQAGESVGYGSRFMAKETMTIAVIACGYADGYPRHARDGTPVWVAGIECPLVGRVSMDMLTVDVSKIPAITVGAQVELFGDHLSVDRVAAFADTIAYEILCAISPRVPRAIETSP